MRRRSPPGSRGDRLRFSEVGTGGVTRDRGASSMAKRGSEREPEALDSTTVLNPVVGFSTEDLLRTARDLLGRALLQPSVVLEQSARLWQDSARIFLGRSDLAADQGDKRFGHQAWRDNALYRNTLQGWLAWHRSLRGFVAASDLGEVDIKRAEFLVDLIADAVAPTNFLLGNPAALERALETGGTSLFQGLRHYLDDLVTNQGMPSQVDRSQFEVGRNVATPGAVVHRSEIFELIQYTPTTPRVYAKPILIVLPQINKYYVYDISPEKSFVAHAVAQGLQTFILSVAQPNAGPPALGARRHHVAAVEEGISAALEISGQETLNDGVSAPARAGSRSPRRSAISKRRTTGWSIRSRSW